MGDHAYIKGRLGWKNLKQNEYTDDGPKMIAGRHIKDGEVDWSLVDHIPLWRYEESPEIMLQNDDIIFSKDGTLGNPALIKDLTSEATINATMMLVRMEDTITPYFLFQILNSNIFQRLIHLKVSGSSIPHLFQADMNKFKFYTPSLDEQNKITSLLEIMDDMITLYQRKNSKNMALRNYINRLIFRDNKNNIKETTLGNLMSKGGSGGTPRTTIKEYYDGGIPFLSITDISISNGKIESTEKNISKLGLKNSSAYLVPKNAVCLAMYASVGKVGLTNIELSTSQAFYNLEFKSPHLAKYIYYRLRYADENNEWKPYIGVGTQGNLNAETVKNFIIKIPSDQHIKYYVNQLNNLDNLINNTSIIIEKLNKLKSFYLSKVFI